MMESIITVALEVVKCLAPPTGHQISYLRNYTSNIENLKQETKKLMDDRESIQHAVDEAKRNGHVIEKKAQEWLGSVNNAIVEAEIFEGNEAAANQRCFKGLCPNLKARFRYSKAAVKKLKDVSKLREEGRFDRISYRSSPEDIRLLLTKDYEAFQSRMSTSENILAALKNPSINMLGIYGMGGIGKTMLAKQVARLVESDNLFDQVVFVEVSQSPDIRKIQGEIAEKLGIKLEAEYESGRARIIYDRLKKEKKILLILDSVWEKLDLLAVGIPHGEHHKGCKILLTARSQESLSIKMDCQQHFQIGTLDDEEAWRLFKKMAGEYIESSQYKSVATDVVKECAGLPISIATVARALRNKTTSEWNDALQQLRRPSLTNFKNIQKEAYSAIELSYNYLETEELKKVFLLTGYTYIEHVDDLLMYGMGLGLFQGISLMTEARNRVRSLVNKLKASCMLLEHVTKHEERFSMHDVVRDVAISIASTNGELYNQWTSSDESAVKLYTSMVLHDVKAGEYPELPECPRLQFISIRGDKSSSSIPDPDSFFRKMMPVRVLALTDMHPLALPASLGLLTNLQTLCLNRCNLKDIAVVGDLEMLKILSIEDFKLQRLPKEVGQLTRLRLLDLRGCPRLQVIPPNVLSKLSHLEELYIYPFKQWGKVVVEGSKNASPDELKHLTKLTSLELYIEDVNILPKGLFFFEKLEKYDICIGQDRLEPNSTWVGSCRRFKLELNANVSLKDGLMMPLKGVEELSLCGLQEKDINYFASELLKGGSSQLKYLTLINCAAPNASGLKHHQGPEVPDLRYLRVEAKQMPWICQFKEDLLSKVEYLDVSLDESSSGISSFDDFFPRFHVKKFLFVSGTGFFGSIEFVMPAVVIRKVNEFGDIKNILKPSPLLENLETLHIHKLDCDNLNNLMPSSTILHNLTTMEVTFCKGFAKLLTSSTAKSLVRLRKMNISFCYKTTEIVVDDDDEGDNNSTKDEIIFNELKELTLSDLYNLTSFCSGNCTFKFSSLETLMVKNCPSVRIFSGGELSTPKLRKVQLDKEDEEKWTWKGDLNTTIQHLYDDIWTRKKRTKR